MKIKHYIITAVVIYFLFLIYLAPATPIVSFLIKDNNNISISSVKGSLWEGTAQSLSINRHEIKELQWSFIAWRLLLGEVSFDTLTFYQGNPVSTTIGLSLTGKLLIHDLNTTISAYTAGRIIDILIGELDGEITVNIDSAVWAAGSVPKITGELVWKNAAYIVAERTELGDLTVKFSENDASPLSATIANSPGQLSVNGTLNVNNEGHYDLDITLKPTNKASNNLRKSLKLVAKPRPDGSFEINNAGDLSTLGLM